MNKILQKYIDLNLIDEYADKDLIAGYSLDIDQISEKEQENFLDFLFKNDAIMKEIAFERMQELINERICFIEHKDKDEAGLRTITDQNNGETIWIRGAA